MSESFGAIRIVSILSSNWYNTVTSIESIMELLKKKGADLPTRALLLCDDNELGKIQPDDVIGRIEAMGLEVEPITPIPKMNDILDEDFAYSPEDGDVINSRPGTGTHLGLILSCLADSLKVRNSIRFYLADISANGTSMAFSRVALNAEAVDTRIDTVEHKFESLDFLEGVLEDGMAESWVRPAKTTKLGYDNLRIFKIHESLANDDDGEDVITNMEMASSYKELNNIASPSRGKDLGDAFEELVGLEMLQCGNVIEVFMNIKWRKDGRIVREEDSLALTSKGNVVFFSAKHCIRDNGDMRKRQVNNKMIQNEIERLEGLELPGNYPRQRVFYVLITTTPLVHAAQRSPDVIVTNLFELCQNISHL